MYELIYSKIHDLERRRSFSTFAGECEIVEEMITDAEAMGDLLMAETEQLKTALSNLLHRDITPNS